MAEEKIGIPGNVRRIHCVGIGGSGMFPLVQMLRSWGYDVRGSDVSEGDIVSAERDMGIRVVLGHRAENIGDADLVLYSAAIADTNPELTAARERGLPLWERARMLGAVSARYGRALGVCGTHGKTTTTAMVSQILIGAGMDPSCVIGGKLPLIGGYGRVGTGDVLVYEACEFRDTFLETHPDFALILNIDNDHMEYFGTVGNAMRSYAAFASKAHTVLYNRSDGRTARAMEDVPRDGKTLWTFGRDSGADFYPARVRRRGGRAAFDWMRRGVRLASLEIHVPGEQNVLNAVAAASAALLLGAAPGEISRELAKFTGVGRRFEILGTAPGGATVADDYAHHPTELSVTLRVARELGFRRIWAVFQPFTFSRTVLLMEDFAEALRAADRVILPPVMGGREVNTSGVRSEDLAARIPGAVCLPTFGEIADYVNGRTGAGDLVLTLGCGDVYKCARMILGRAPAAETDGRKSGAGPAPRRGEAEDFGK